jgi:hypothetical protein
MNITYELWDVGTGKIVGAFATLDEGLTVVRYLLDSYGHNYAQDLGLGRREEEGSIHRSRRETNSSK